jgi:hypothetical protein
VTWADLLLLALAVYRVTRLITTDSLTAPWREDLVYRFPPRVEPMRAPDGSEIPGSARSVPHWVVRLVHCDWCVSIWTSLALTLAAHFAGLLDSWQLAGFVWLAASSAAGLLSRIGA